MQREDIHFGMAGLAQQDREALQEDAFLGFGKKAKRRREARRARRKERRAIRFERRRLKNDDRRAETEAKRAQTAVLKATMLEQPSPTYPVPPATTPLTVPKAVQPMPKQASVPLNQKASFGGNTTVFVVGALVLGGYYFMNKQKQNIPPVSQ